MNEQVNENTEVTELQKLKAELYDMGKSHGELNNLLGFIAGKFGASNVEELVAAVNKHFPEENIEEVNEES